MPLDRETLRRCTDRRETGAVLATLSAGVHIEEAIEALLRLDDPRVLPDLRRILHDPRADEDVRDASGEVLTGMCSAPDPSDGELREWWVSNDAVLRRHAYASSTTAQRDLVVGVLRELEHPRLGEMLRHLSIAVLQSGEVAHALVPLLDRDPVVAAEAAWALKWSEALTAGPALLRAAIRDDDAVVSAALRTLAYYPCVATAQCAMGSLACGSDTVRASARACVAHLRDVLSDALLVPAVAPHLRAWLEPVWDGLQIALGEVEATVAVPLDATRVVYPWLRSADALLARFGDLDGDWDDRGSELRDADWRAAPRSERSAMAAHMIGSPDAALRVSAARALGEWDDGARLRELVEDACFVVRSEAMYRLREVSPDPRLAAFAWAESERVLDTDLHVAMGTAITLSAPGSWYERGRTIALDADALEADRVTVVRALADDGAREIVRSLLPLLQEPPALTWELHEALADAAEKLALPLPNLEVHADVDHLHAQVLVARSRVGA